MSYCVEKGMSHNEFLSWSPEDRAKTVAYLIEQADTCQLCGTAEWQWEENKYAFMPHEKWCKGCYLKHTASDDAGKLPGTTVVMVPTTPQRIYEQELREERRAKMKAEND